MDLLCEATINGTLHRVSDEWHQLTNLWEPYISAYSPTKFGMATQHGGYVRPKWGKRTFTPDLFSGSGDFPPPKTITVVDKLTDSTEAAAVTVFEGTLHLEGYDEEGVTYNAWGAEYQVTETSKAYTSTLNSIFSDACDAAKLNLTLDTTAARSPSPDVNYTTSGEHELLDDLSDIAAFFCHAFYIEDGTLYLIDLLADNGTSTADEFQYFRGSRYEASPPYSLFIAGDRTVTGSYAYGKEFDVSPVCHTTNANIDDALDDIKTIIEYDRYMFRLIPESDQLPVIGQKITITNDSLEASVSTWVRVTDIMPDVTKSEIVIEGFGVTT